MQIRCRFNAHFNFLLRQFIFDSLRRWVNNNYPPIKLTLNVSYKIYVVITDIIIYYYLRFYLVRICLFLAFFLCIFKHLLLLILLWWNFITLLITNIQNNKFCSLKVWSQHDTIFFIQFLPFKAICTTFIGV